MARHQGVYTAEVNSGSTPSPPQGGSGMVDVPVRVTVDGIDDIKALLRAVEALTERVDRLDRHVGV